MAGPIKIAVLADAKAATADVKSFTADVESSVGRSASALEDASRRSSQAGRDMADGIERGVDGADKAEQRVMGFRDTLTGAQDTMKGTALIAQGDLFNGFLTLGMGLGDLASGFANLLIPLVGKAAGAMKALNLTFLTNPVFLVIAAIVALVAVFVIAYKKSETFRRIVDGAFRGVLNAARAAWSWVKRNWPLLLAIITGPIGLAVRWVTKHWDTIKAKARAIPGAIKGAFSNAGTLLRDAGSRIVSGLWEGVRSLEGWLRGKVTSFIQRTVPGPVRNALGIASPSRVARRLGGYFGQGLGLGLDDERGRVSRAAANLAAATIASPPGASSAAGGASSAAGGATARVEFDSGGDPVLDYIFRELRKRMRIRGNAEVIFV